MEHTSGLFVNKSVESKQYVYCKENDGMRVWIQFCYA